jgi:hypothetical protein
MTGKGLIIVIAGVILISGLIFRNIFTNSDSLTKNMVNSYQRQVAYNIAQSGVNIGLRQLNNDPSWRTGYNLMDMLGGKVMVRVVDTIFNYQNVVSITSVGYTDYGKSTMLSDTSIAYISKGFIPAAVLAAITTNNSIQTLGTITIDGRNHSITGNLISATGTNGIWTTSTFSQGGNSQIGGTAGINDYSPGRPGDTHIIKTGQVWPGGYPNTPDGVLGGPAHGYPEGTLKTMALSGTGGSQYTTNPATLSYPLKGVTYVELPYSGIWKSSSINGSGILIVHNDKINAIMKNVNGGTFTGILIVDDIIQFKATLIGALICLNPFPSSGNCLGNGNGDILYSTDAIINATNVSGAAGAGSSKSSVIAWYE